MGEYFYFNVRLTEKLNRIRQKPLTVVSAYGNFGKRTAVQAYLMNLKGKMIWHVTGASSAPAFADEMLELLNREIAAYTGSCDRAEADGENTATADPVRLSRVIAGRMKQITEVLGSSCFYVAEVRGELRQDVLDFLYTLASWHVNRFLIIIITETRDLGGLEHDTDSVVNLISESFFLLKQEDIQKGFGEQKVMLMPEEAALVWQFTNGWLPLVSSVFQQFAASGKKKTWEAIPHLLYAWEDKIDPPEKMGYTKVMCDILTRMSPADSFSIEEAIRICVHPDTLPAVCDERSLRQSLRPGKLPPFMYYHVHSGRYHVHQLIRTWFVRAYQEIPEAEKESIQAEFARLGELSAGRHREAESIRRKLLGMEFEEVKRHLQLLYAGSAFSGSMQDAEIRTLSAWSGILNGNAPYEIEALESDIGECFAEGRWAAGRYLIFESLLIKELLGQEYVQKMGETEDFILSDYHVNRVRYPERAVFLIAAILRRRRELERLEMEMAQAGIQQDPFLELIRRLMITSAKRAQNKDSDDDFAAALEIGEEYNMCLPFAVLYEDLFPHISEQKAGGSAILDKVAGTVNLFRRRMRKNYEKVNDSYGTQLTRRQSEVADLLRQRLSNKEIALRLGISENTVKTTVKAVFRKLGVEKRQSFYE